MNNKLLKKIRSVTANGYRVYFLPCNPEGYLRVEVKKFVKCMNDFYNCSRMLTSEEAGNEDTIIEVIEQLCAQFNNFNEVA